MSQERAKINYLIHQVEIYHKRPIKTTVHFEALSAVIEHQTGERISASTLKRLWGYVADRHAPREYTLDVLAKYIGHSNFREFCKKISDDNGENSDFFTIFQIATTDLSTNDKVEIGWSPDRYLILKYLGDNRFRVDTSQNSKLAVGDEFIITNFMLTYPLYIPSVNRNGEILPSFVGGKSGGLTILATIK